MDKPPILCRLVGHKYDPIGAEIYQYYYCERCGHNGMHDGPSVLERIKTRWWVWKNEWRECWHRWRRWWKCCDCGGRFGRHDYDRCIPF